MANTILGWLEENTEEQVYDKAPQSAPDYTGEIRIEFWSGEFTFVNENDEPVKGQIKGQTHQTKLLRRAMERARDEGKQLRVTNGMDTARFEQVTDEDIKIHCRG